MGASNSSTMKNKITTNVTNNFMQKMSTNISNKNSAELSLNQKLVFRAPFATLKDCNLDIRQDQGGKVKATMDSLTQLTDEQKANLASEISNAQKQALEQAKAGRLHILDKITETIAAPNADLKPQTPRVEMFTVPNDTIGAIIGPGGKIIQQLQKDTNTTITIEELENGEGQVQIMSNNADDMNAAVKAVRLIAFPPQVDEGEIYEGPIKSIQSYGVFVEILPGTDGLIHISEFAHERIGKMEDVCKEGEIVKFKVVGRDPKTKKWKLSRKVLLPKPEKKEEAPKSE